MDIEPEISNSKNRTGVIDVIAHDPKKGEVVLVMDEPNEWDGSDEQLLALQERFNAYVSFLLDGEMSEAIQNWPANQRESNCVARTCPIRERSNC